MAITIDGDGTITGVSVGGLPDGIVDTDMIAAPGAVTGAKRGEGAILQIKQTVKTDTSFHQRAQTHFKTFRNVGVYHSIIYKQQDFSNVRWNVRKLAQRNITYKTAERIDKHLQGDAEGNKFGSTQIDLCCLTLHTLFS